MFKRLFAAAVVLAAMSAHAQSLDTSNVKVGDTWTINQTTDKGNKGFSQVTSVLTVERVSGDTMVLSAKQLNSPQEPTELMMGSDWSRMRDMNGKQQIYSQPMKFPLKEGKSWTVEYTEQNPNREHLSETFHIDYKAVGWEDVQVTAGTFHALKIEADGQWSAVTAPTNVVGATLVSTPDGTTSNAVNEHAQSRNISGRLYKEYWYVPSQKRFVKSVEDVYDTKGLRSIRYTQELMAAKVAN